MKNKIQITGEIQPDGNQAEKEISVFYRRKAINQNKPNAV